MKLVKFKRSGHDQWIMTVEQGWWLWKHQRQYIGSSTCWTTFPEFRCVYSVERAMRLYELQMRARYELYQAARINDAALFKSRAS